MNEQRSVVTRIGNFGPRRPYPLEAAAPLPPEVVSMMFPSELDVLYSIAKHYYSGRGDIIDAGIYLGASTYCFAKGLAQNPKRSNQFHIHSYERAIVTPAMLRGDAVRTAIGPIGSDYGAYLGRLVAPLGDAVRLHCGDILDMEYKGTIEIVFLDILKTRKLFEKCNAMFMGSLIPNHSLVIQQDYYWHLDWYINAYMELLSDYFQIVDSAETSCVFLNTKQIPREMFERNPLTGLRRQEVVQLLERSRNRASSLFQYMMSDLCIVHFAANAGLQGVAAKRIADFSAQFGRVLNNLADQPSIRRVRAAYATLAKQISQRDRSSHNDERFLLSTG